MVLAVVILKSAILSILLDILKMRGRKSYRVSTQCEGLKVWQAGPKETELFNLPFLKILFLSLVSAEVAAVLLQFRDRPGPASLV